jgi:hypothetical protein
MASPQFSTRNENGSAHLLCSNADSKAKSLPLFSAEEILHHYLFFLSELHQQGKTSLAESQALTVLSRLRETGCPGRERLLEISG